MTKVHTILPKSREERLKIPICVRELETPDSSVDTSICVETSIRDTFNIGYDIILISDVTASDISHYETTLARVSEYYQLQMTYERFTKMINNLNLIRENLDSKDLEPAADKFIRKLTCWT